MPIAAKPHLMFSHGGNRHGSSEDMLNLHDHRADSHRESRPSFPRLRSQERPLLQYRGDHRAVDTRSDWFPIPAAVAASKEARTGACRVAGIDRDVWLPFRETRTHSWASAKAGKHSVVRSELVVTEVRTGVDLAERYAKLLPREGEAIQDQRFSAAVN